MSRADEKPCSRLLVAALCGLPGCGKSSLCSALQGLACDDLRICCVDFDATPYEGGWSSAKWHQQRAESLRLVAAGLASMLESLRTSKARRTVLLCDDNSFYRSMRRSIHSIVRSAVGGDSLVLRHFAIVHVHCSPDTCKSRDAVRLSGRVGSDVIERMSAMLQPPCTPHADGTHTWEQPLTRCLDGTQAMDELVAQVWSWLRSEDDSGPWCDRHVVPPLSESNAALVEEERARVRQDVVHQADLALRKKVSQTMQGIREKEMMAQQLSVRRKSALDAVRTQCSDPSFLASLEALRHESGEDSTTTHLPAIVEHLVNHAWAQSQGSRPS